MAISVSSLRFPRTEGNEPSSRFCVKRSTFSADNPPMLWGISPVKLLAERSRVCSCLKPEEKSGKLPTRRLLERLRSCKWEQREKEGESKVPLRLVLEIERDLRVGIRQKTKGNPPTKPELLRSMDRIEELVESQVMPVQLQALWAWFGTQLLIEPLGSWR